jgi:GTP cyclohydrolase I
MNTSPPLGPKPKSLLASRLLNGTSSSTASSISRTEREKLAASIENSHTARVPVDLDREDNEVHPVATSQALSAIANRPRIHSHLTEPPRDARDGVLSPPTASRSASPYTANPPIDFDGLSWPSE